MKPRFKIGETYRIWHNHSKDWRYLATVTKVTRTYVYLEFRYLDNTPFGMNGPHIEKHLLTDFLPGGGITIQPLTKLELALR